MDTPPLIDGLWRGRRCFVLGGGPSLADFDPEWLKDELTIGVNMAFRFNPTVAFVYDQRLMLELSEDPEWKAYKGIKVWLTYEGREYRRLWPEVMKLREAKRGTETYWSKSLADGLYRKTNAGISALNLAEILGADPIYLLGYDFHGAHGQSVNWHNKYPKRQKAKVYNRFVEDFNSRARSIKANVINLNPDSALHCFRFGKVPDVIPYTPPPMPPEAREPTQPICVYGMHGLGDTLFYRPVVKLLSDTRRPVYVETPWPQLFWDLPDVIPVMPSRIWIRVTAMNSKRTDRSQWQYGVHPGVQRVGLRYFVADLRSGTPPATTFMNRLRMQGSLDWSLRPKPEWVPEWIKDLKRPIGVVHPCTLRREWFAPSRNPHPQYIQKLIDSAPHVSWVSVAALQEGHEWIDGKPLSGISKRFEHAELSVENLIGLSSAADFIVAPVGFLLMLGLSLGTPTFCVWGGHIPPENLLDPDARERVTIVAPRKPCSCFNMKHGCEKDIEPARLITEFLTFLRTHRCPSAM